MATGRPTNQERAAARMLGERTWRDPAPCVLCGDRHRYTSNGACVTCAIERGKQRYAALDGDARAEWKRRDHERYLRRLGE